MNESGAARGRIAGLVLAAGRSRRMGRLKQTLSWGDAGSTIIASAFDAIAPHCDRMSIVMGADEDALAISDALSPREFARIDSDPDAEMIDSLSVGLITVFDQFPNIAAVLLQPGDHPGVASATIRALLEAFGKSPDLAIIPEHRGKGGHPALIPSTVARLIVDWRQRGGEGGLRQLWIDHPQWRRRLAVDDPLCVVDLDTPDEYQQARDRFFAS